MPWVGLRMWLISGRTHLRKENSFKLNNLFILSGFRKCSTSRQKGLRLLGDNNISFVIVTFHHYDCLSENLQRKAVLVISGHVVKEWNYLSFIDNVSFTVINVLGGILYQTDLVFAICLVRCF